MELKTILIFSNQHQEVKGTDTDTLNKPFFPSHNLFEFLLPKYYHLLGAFYFGQF